MAKTKFGALLEQAPELIDPDEAVAKGAAIYGTLKVQKEFAHEDLDAVVLPGVIRDVSFHGDGIRAESVGE